MDKNQSRKSNRVKHSYQYYKPQPLIHAARKVVLMTPMSCAPFFMANWDVWTIDTFHFRCFVNIFKAVLQICIPREREHVKSYKCFHARKNVMPNAWKLLKFTSSMHLKVLQPGLRQEIICVFCKRGDWLDSWSDPFAHVGWFSMLWLLKMSHSLSNVSCNFTVIYIKWFKV